MFSCRLKERRWSLIVGHFLEAVVGFSFMQILICRFFFVEFKDFGLESFNGSMLAVKTCKAVIPMNEQSYFHQVAQRPLIYKTIGSVFDEAVRKYGDKVAIVDCAQHKRYTFKHLEEEVNSLAAGLLELGFKPNDVVAIWSHNSLEWCISYYALAKAGIISVLLNPLNQISEMEYCLNKVNVKGIFIPKPFRAQNYYEILQKLCPELIFSIPGQLNSKKIPSLKYVFTYGFTLPGSIAYDDIIKLANQKNKRLLKEISSLTNPEEGINIQFTSGTTGLSKATLLSHMGVLNNAIYVGCGLKFNESPPIICAQGPLFHVFATIAALGMNTLFGGSIILPAPAYSPTKSLESIQTEKCTFLYGTPTMFIDVINIQKERNYDCSSLKVSLIGGSASPNELFRKIKKTFEIHVWEGYGMTEVSGLVYMYNTDSEKILSDILSNLEVKVVDKNGRTVPKDTSGELCVRGYSVMVGYYNDQEKTREIIDDLRWIKTGDQFVFHQNQRLELAGRVKDMIIRGGENVFPKEIEEFIGQMPGILECVVYGVPDSRLGEEICLAVRLEKDVTLTLEQLQIFLKDKIASYKIPKYLRIFPDFPRTPTGKTQRIKLQEITRNEFILTNNITL